MEFASGVSGSEPPVDAGRPCRSCVGAGKSNATAGTAVLTPKWRASTPTSSCGFRARRSCPYWASSTPCARRWRWPAWSGSHDRGWSHRFQSDLVRIEQYAECGCELVVTEPVTNLPELWEDLEADREAANPGFERL